MFKTFWNWYEKHEQLNTLIAAGLFALQLIHLFWLTTDIVLPRLGMESIFPIDGIYEILVILVDYTEIPALITTSLVYLNANRKKFSFKNLLYLFFLNVQLIHMFWLTDEFVVEQFTSSSRSSLLPFWAAWIAIGIDYLELPVIYDTLKQSFGIIKNRKK